MVTDNITNVNNTSIVMKFYRAERWCWLHHLKILSKIIWRLMFILFARYIPPTIVLMEGVKNAVVSDDVSSNAQLLVFLQNR